MQISLYYHILTKNYEKIIRKTKAYRYHLFVFKNLGNEEREYYWKQKTDEYCDQYYFVNFRFDALSIAYHDYINQLNLRTQKMKQI